MCFSVNVNLVKEELENRFGATLIDPDKYRPSYYYHAFSLPDLPVVCSGSANRISMMKWGLIPSWTKSEEDADIIRYKTFNARAESIYEKASFSLSFKSRRCIVPVAGFFEWQHTGKIKIPWYIYHFDNEILSFAGLYDEWINSENGKSLSTFSIITTAANEMMAQIHNSGKRMPAILDKSGEEEWLDLSRPKDQLLKLLKPASSEILKAHEISSLVNDKYADRNRSEVIEPYERPKQNLLF